ncbi:MAG: lysozyme inhibitor LprI family protein [Bosea sp. (in: a-proteobacteria)]
MASTMRQCAKTLALVALAFAPEPAKAEGGLSKAFAACIETSGGVTSNMLDCADSELKLQDLRLNKAYRELSGSLNVKRRRDLVEVQRLWIRFRDANCAFYEDPDGGTASALAASSCFLQATATRAKELEDLK